MITEDYVSFETAKLLKEKGFDCRVTRSFFEHDNCYAPCDPSEVPRKDAIAIPTLQMAMKWLRTEHNIFFNVNYFHLDVGNKWVYLTIWLPYKNGCEFSVEGFDIETVYEDAIKYCLKNLI